MRLAIIIGTRPEIIKLQSLIRECDEYKKENSSFSYISIHSGQHYDKILYESFLKEFNLKKPDYFLTVGSGTHAIQTAKALEKIEAVLLKEKVDAVIIQGDTNTTLAGALAASKIQKKVIHVEAGLRSFDWRMPEEKNRILIDHISDILFAPTDIQANNLIKEGIEPQKIFIVGNTIADTVRSFLPLTRKDVLKKYGLQSKKYTLLTLHRPENVDSKSQLEKIIKSITICAKKYNTKILFPIHPRTKKNCATYGIKLDHKIYRLINPVGYKEMLTLIKEAGIILTDSGGVQEEAFIVGTPALILRISTDRPETLKTGSCIIVKNIEQNLDSAWQCLSEKKIENHHSPYGMQNVAHTILNVILALEKENIWNYLWLKEKQTKKIDDIIKYDPFYKIFHDLAGKPKNKSNLLEVGCGSGIRSIAYKKFYQEISFKVALLDNNPVALRYASFFAKKNNVKIKTILGDALKLPFPKDTFDIVWNEGVNEHFEGENRQLIFNEMSRVCKPGGKVIVIAPNRFNLVYRLVKYILQKCQIWEFGYENTFSLKELQYHLKMANLKIIASSGQQILTSLKLFQYVIEQLKRKRQQNKPTNLIEEGKDDKNVNQKIKANIELFIRKIDILIAKNFGQFLGKDIGVCGEK